MTGQYAVVADQFPALYTNDWDRASRECANMANMMQQPVSIHFKNGVDEDCEIVVHPDPDAVIVEATT